MELFLGTIIGLAAGIAIGMLVQSRLKKDSVGVELEQTLRTISQEAMHRQSEQILQMAEQKLGEHIKLGGKDLDQKKSLIDQVLNDMKENLTKVDKTMKELESDRAQKFGALDQRLQSAALVIGELNQTTSSLKNALANNSGRGQWGERMAEDVLRLSGMIEGINYMKQKTLTEDRSRPDFTFLLPQQLKLHMDVKFPFNNYEKYMNTDNEQEKEKAKQQFLRDVRKHIKDVKERSYIDAAETVDYVLVFIPNEQIFSFINEHDRSLIDEALKGKTILCSPLSLYAILALIRQSIDIFSLEKKSNDMLSLFGKFKEEWEKFRKTTSDFGDKLNRLQQEYSQKVVGTRANMLERPLNKIESLRQERAIPVAELEDLQESIAEQSEEPALVGKE